MPLLVYAEFEIKQPFTIRFTKRRPFENTAKTLSERRRKPHRVSAPSNVEQGQAARVEAAALNLDRQWPGHLRRWWETQIGTPNSSRRRLSRTDSAD